MPSVLKNLMARLKRRRRARSWPLSWEGSRSGGKTENAITRGIEALSLDSSSKRLQSPHVFGEDDDFHFSFDFQCTEKAWPGPSFDDKALMTTRILEIDQQSQHGQSHSLSLQRVKRSMSERPERKTGKADIRAKKSPPRPQYFGRPPPRDPPHHLLNLPGEIRNQIHRLLYVSEKPLIAQFRVIIKPRQGYKKQPNTYRRFPREPALAAVCRQLQRESLSIFYGENKFVLRKSEHAQLSSLTTNLTPTSALGIKRWAPKGGFAEALTYLEVQFKVWESRSRTDEVTYIFRRQAGGTLSIEFPVTSRCCTCVEERVEERMKEVLARGECSTELLLLPEGLGLRDLLGMSKTEHITDLTSFAAKMVPTRFYLYQSDPDWGVGDAGATCCSIRPVCDVCGLRRVYEVSTGF